MLLRAVVELLLLCSAAAFSTGAAHRRSVPARAPIAMQEQRFEVCQGRYCSKKGAKRTLKLFEELKAGAPSALVEVADMGHTDHGCFDECTMGRERGRTRKAAAHSVDQQTADPGDLALLQRTCASAAMGLSQTAGRSSTASRARPRWRSCLESTLRPMSRGVRVQASSPVAPVGTAVGVGGSCAADPQPARVPAPIRRSHRVLATTTRPTAHPDYSKLPTHTRGPRRASERVDAL